MYTKLNRALAMMGLVLAVTSMACQNGFMSTDVNANDGADKTDPTAPGPGELPDTTDGPRGCTPDDRFFMREVWAPAVKNSCFACHNEQGAARDSDFVLYNQGWGNYIERNMAVLTEFAQTKRDNESVLLLKPLARVSHGGGAVIAEGDDVYNRLKAFVQRSENPSTCSAANDDDFYQDVVFLDDAQTMRKAALSLAGRVPSQVELDSGNLDAVLDQLMGEPAFEQRLTESFNDLLLTDMYLPGASAIDLVDEDMFPDVRYWESINDQDARNAERNRVNRAIAREPIELIKHIVREGRPYSELLTANYTMVNPYSARAFGLDVTFLDDTDENEWVEAQIPGYPHAGVLTTVTFLMRYPTTDTNRNRTRSATYYLYFLSTDILKLAERPIDPTQADMSQNPTLFDAQCTVCHDVMDPVAGAFQNWDVNGHYAPREAGWYLDMLPAGIEGVMVPSDRWGESLSWLASRAADDPRFVESAVHHAYTLLTGQSPLSLPTDATRADYEAAFRAYEVQYEFFKQLGIQFKENGFDFKVLLKEIVKSPAYRATNAGSVTPKRQLELANFGTSRLLTPEMLNRKIIATTGIEWRNNNRNVLLNTNEFHLLYGGIDSNTVTKRMTEPNALAASIARRMSNEVGCRATVLDFSKPSEERMLFPGVDIASTPVDSAAIRSGIQHLYWQLLGEVYEVTDPEIDRAFELFSDIYEDGNANNYGNQLPNVCRVDGLESDPDYTVRSWMGVVSYMLADYGFLHE